MIGTDILTHWTGISIGLLATLCILTLVSGTVRTWIMLGTGMTWVPTASLLMTPQLAAAIWAPLAVAGDVLSITAYPRLWDNRLLRMIIPPAVMGVIISAWTYQFMNQDLVQMVLGILLLTLVTVQLLARGNLPVFKPFMPAAIFVGLIGGLVHGLGAGGVLIVAQYLLLLNLDQNKFISTLSILLFIVNMLKMIVYWLTGLISGDVLFVSLLILPFLAIGTRLGRWLNGHTSGVVFRRIIIGVMGFLAIVLIYPL
jgi:uncharacterized membrane protein YfcA